MKAAQILLGAPTMGGGDAPGQGFLVEGIKGGKEVFQPAEIHKNGIKKCWFPTLFGFKVAKAPFFALKCLIRHTVHAKCFLRNTLI